MCQNKRDEQWELKQYEKVKEITKALNEMIKDVGLSIQLAESSWDRNIYTQTTEVAYQCGDNMLVLIVPDIWLEQRDGQLENYIGQTLACNLQMLWDACFDTEFSKAIKQAVFEPDKGKFELNKDKCECGCCHVPDHGACQTFEMGANGRCVYCDHGKDCHPGDPNKFNTPLGVG